MLLGTARAWHALTCTALRGRTQRMPLSAAAHQAHACDEHVVHSTITALVDLRIVGASCQHDGGRARAWLARPRATQT